VTLTATVSTAGLTAGTYAGSITITSTGAANSPQTVPVTLVVSPASTGSAKLPSIDSIQPFVGSAPSQVFTASYSHPDGATSLAKVNAQFGDGNVFVNSCELEYDVPNARFRLLADNGVSWLGPVAAGSLTTIENSQCRLIASNSYAQMSGTQLNVRYDVTFKTATTNKLSLLLLATDNRGSTTNWTCLGAWWANPAAAMPVNRYRLYDPYSRSHHYTTDLNEYNVLGTRGYVQEGVSSVVYAAPGTVGGVALVPYYRIYIPAGFSHHWTTDRYEYQTLIYFVGTYVGEGIDGFLFPQQVSQTVAWNRLVFLAQAFPPIHHWTADAYETKVLTSSGAWKQEGIDGWVYPPPPAGQKGPSGALLERDSSTPVIGSVVHAATKDSGPVAPGEMIQIFGKGIGESTRVLINDEPALVLGSSDQQIAAVVPLNASGKISMQLDNLGERSKAVELEVVPSNPGVFTGDPFGRGRAISPDGAALQPGTQVTFYLTGQGANADPLEVTIGGYKAEVVSTEGQPGRTAVTVLIPNDASGPSALTVKVGNAYTQSGVSLAVEEH
jgi:uncharacterized protein (TIGR03437 family)